MAFNLEKPNSGGISAFVVVCGEGWKIFTKNDLHLEINLIQKEE
jgi:hypothetical protein